MELLSQQAQAVTRERQKLEAEAAKRRSHQSTMNKAVKNLVRQSRGVVERIHETEMGAFIFVLCCLLPVCTNNGAPASRGDGTVHRHHEVMDNNQ